MWNGIDGNDSLRVSTEELAELWYRAVLMMPSDCDFATCRKLVEYAAKSMKNLTNEQRSCVSEAFDEVGIITISSIGFDLTDLTHVDYHLTKESTLSVYAENGELCSRYTLSVSGETIDNEQTVSREEKRQYSTIELLAGAGKTSIRKPTKFIPLNRMSLNYQADYIHLLFLKRIAMQYIC